jgi:hypothetical protein
LILAAGCAVLLGYWRYSHHATKPTVRAFDLNPIPVHQLPIPSGSCVSVMGYDDDLAQCTKNLPSAMISTDNDSAAKNLADCSIGGGREAWLVGHGASGQIFTGAAKLIDIGEAAKLQNINASTIRLAGCWTGAGEEGQNLVNKIQSYTHRSVWSQNSIVFCVPRMGSSSDLFLYDKSVSVEATPEHQAVKADALLLNANYTSIRVVATGETIPVSRDKVFVARLTSIGAGPLFRKEFLVTADDRTVLTRQLLNLIDFPNPFPVGEPAMAGIPAARPAFRVTLSIDGELRDFTVYGGLLRDDENPNTYYLMDINGYTAFSSQLNHTYKGLLTESLSVSSK